MPDTVTLPPCTLVPALSVDALVAQAAYFLTLAYAAAQATCAGYNVELLTDAADACEAWLAARGA